MRRVDLHMHSHASDGHLAPAEVVRAAVAGRLDVIALTDHDTVDGLSEAIAAARDLPIQVIPGVELSALEGDAEIHVLGYHIDPDAPSLRAHQEGALGRRLERMRQMVQKLQEQGIDIHYEDVMAAAGPATSAIGRPHVARALLAGGHIRSYGEAFDRYLRDGGLAFVRTELPSVREVIEMIREAGGVAVWAHPDPEVFEARIGAFAEWGLAGVECFRPTTPATDIRRFLAVARELGLFPTGGSDWHGPHRALLGDFFVPADQVGELLALAPSG